mmetsp:Transcript_20134/g.27877  ORF Transcript_20134/g.27877 Transcript_20134/m.27877 type:complete len:146 (+) Transcript_20134:128-565(+)
MLARFSRIVRITPLVHIRASYASTTTPHVKVSTGLVGLDVEPNAREILIGLYERTLGEIQAVPADAGYRQVVEEFTNYRLQVCKDNTDLQAIEDAIMQGQVEELIDIAKDELSLIPRMIERKPWIIPEGHTIKYKVDNEIGETIP